MRKKGLDILRAVAVLLVLFRHSKLEENILYHFGWLGVDLFFVLSGFLVSGLLFTQYKEKESVNIKRFLIRRGFKIFPPFYFFMFSTILVACLWNGTAFDWKRILSEFFYLQSYTPHVWLHTWTLAVEEHFYFVLAALVFILSKKHWIAKKKFMISALVFLVLLSFLLRLQVSFPHRDEPFFSFMKSHLRSDGIIIGVLLSYLYHFTQVMNVFLRKKWLTIALAVLLILPGFLYGGASFFMNTIGLTTVNLGFALLVFLSLDLEKYLNHKMMKLLNWPIAVLCFIGVNSYSIYLWHLNSKNIIYTFFDCNETLMTILYFSLAIILGILMSYLIEKSSLKFRDRLFAKNTNL